MNSLIRVCEVDLWDILSFFVIIVDALRSCFSGLYEAEAVVNEQSGLNCFFGDSIIGVEGLAG